MLKKCVLGMGIAALALAGAAQAGTVYWEGFEDPGWVPPGSPGWNNYLGGDIVGVSSGTDGITSSSGSYHAQITNLSLQNDVFGNPGLGTLSPYTFFGGSSSSFGSGFTVSQDMYLDPTWSDGSGFDWSVAVYNQSGSHLRDFIWHVGKVGGDLLVNESNNSDLSFNSGKLEPNANGGPNTTITDPGWYTFETVFYDDGGTLAVDFNLYDASNALKYTATRNSGDNIATTVGGNGYGWFTYNNIDGLNVDNTHLETAAAPVPEPASMTLLGAGLIGMAAMRRKKKHAA